MSEKNETAKWITVSVIAVCLTVWAVVNRVMADFGTVDVSIQKAIVVEAY